MGRANLRVSLIGGGTDLPQFFEKHSGCVIGGAINLSVHVCISNEFDAESIRLKYSESELVRDPADIRHPILRTLIQKYGLKGVEIASFSDVPSGTGLGSSSSFTVALIAAIRTKLGLPMSLRGLAEEACEIEINYLKSQIGFQDQYIASLGGLNKIKFEPGGEVSWAQMFETQEKLRHFSSMFRLIRIEGSRQASSILDDREHSTEQKEERERHLLRVLDLVNPMEEAIMSKNEIIGEILHESWQLKKQAFPRASNPQIDNLYDQLRQRGISGGKLLGAGQSGFLLIFAADGQFEEAGDLVGNSMLDFEFTHEIASGLQIA